MCQSINHSLTGSTLQELRYCFYLAEQERKGGLSPHASPLALPSGMLHMGTPPEATQFKEAFYLPHEINPPY